VLQEFLSRLNNNLYSPFLFVLGIAVILTFFFLPKEKKRRQDLFLLFLFVVLVYFYENLAIYMLVDKKSNAFFHSLISDTPFKGWNIWVMNLFNYQISKLLLLVYLLQLIYSPAKRKIVLGIIYSFAAMCLALQVFGWYPLYNFQPPIYFLGNTALILGCGLYFIDLITEERHLEKDLVKNWNFWIVTLILFQSALSFLADIANDYLVFNDLDLYFFFNYISMILYLLLILTIGLYFITEIRQSKSKLKHLAHAA
jgi:hypothetical protein